MITSRGAGGWTNSLIAPAALGLVGSRPTRRRLVGLLLALTVLTFAGTIAVADAQASKLRPASPCSSTG